MKSFKAYLVESKMTYDEALAIFGVQGGYTEDSIKSKYKALALANHPDRGGDQERMKQINVAYEILKKSVGKVGKNRVPSVDWDAIRKKYKEGAIHIKAILLSKIDIQIFNDYFSKLSGKTFTGQITRTLPLESDSNPHYVVVDMEFKSADKESAFSLSCSIDLNIVFNSSKGLGSVDVPDDIPMTVNAYGFHNNRKQKLSQRDYTLNQSMAGFSKPELIFPKDKLVKIFSGSKKATIFKKRDMGVGLQKKLDATFYNDYATIPLSDNATINGKKNQDAYFLVIYRTVFLKQAGWMLNGLYKGNKRVAMLGVVSVPETEDTLNSIVKIVDGSKKYLKDENGLANYLTQSFKDLK